MNKGAKYILWRFTQLNRARLSIYPHLTQATDTSNVRPSSCTPPSITDATISRFVLSSLPSRRRFSRTLCATVVSSRYLL